MGILQRQQSKIFDVMIKKTSDHVRHWNKIHEDTNWNEFSYDLKHGKKLSRLIFKMVGTGEPKETCGKWVTEGCDNYRNHPKEWNYAGNKSLSCKSSRCSKCWGVWSVREASRTTERIDKFRLLGERKGWRSTKPIHVIVSPPKWLWNSTWVELKKELRKMVKRAGIVGGCYMFHAGRLKDKTWSYSPHFHLMCYGWVIDTKKISSEAGWIIKNKGVRRSSALVHSTVAYLLSHTAIAKGIHSVGWFGDLSYSAKYAFELKREKEESKGDECPYCSQYVVLFEVRGVDRPPPDMEWSGLFHRDVSYPVETIDEMLKRKFWLKKKLQREEKLHVQYWNEDCKKACKKADELIAKLTNATTDITATDTATMDTTLDGELCSVPSLNGLNGHA